jgi:predicted metalloprotease with PDZ domain
VDLEQYVVDESGKTKVDAASSFGVGKQREFEARGRELRGGFYLAGTLGRALFDTPEGHDEAAWLGYTSFDPRPIAADVAAFRTAARELFRFGEETPLTLLIVADNRPAGAFSAARRARSVVVRVGAAEAWTGPVRIAVAAEVLHAWIGGRLWVGPADAAHEAEAAWFTEGLTRHLARDLLFRYGLITSAEVAEEIHGLTSATLTSPWAKASNAEVAAHVKEPHALPLLVARGALYAAALEQRARKKSQGKRGLVDLLRPLFAKAHERRGPLADADWIEAAAAELGPAEKDLFARQIQRGLAAPLPDDALGPCFRGVPREYAAFDLGFDEDQTRAAEGRKLQKLRAGGPADHAGLKEGDALEEAVVGRGRGDVFVTITVKRGGEAKTVKYLPVGAKARGRGFARKREIAEEACAK